MGPIGLLLLAVLFLLAFTSPAKAAKSHAFLEDFGPASVPTFKEAEDVAVDPASGDLLVVDTQPQLDGKVYRFHADGTPSPFSALGTHVIDAKLGPGGKPCAEEAASCDLTPQGGFLDSAGGELSGFGELTQIAIDDSGTATDGNIYVAQTNARLIDVFASDGHYLGQITLFGTKKLGTPTGLAVDGSGALYVADRSRNAVHKYVPSANPPLATDYVEAASIPAEAPAQVALGVGPSAGSIFVVKVQFKEGKVRKYDIATRTLKYVVAQNFANYPRGLVVDPETGHLILSYNVPITGNSSKDVFDTYDVSGASEATLLAHTDPGGEKGFRANGLAIASGNLYISESSKVQVFDAAIATVPDVVTSAASGIAATKATLNGSVDPDGVQVTECTFEYGTTADYGNTAPCAETPAEIGSGTSPVPVHADISGLAPDTHYDFRLVAANPADSVEGGNQSFKTTLAPKEFNLTVTKTGPGTGKVTSSPVGIECGIDCEELYEEGAEVTLEAEADLASEFTGWSGACSGTGSCKVTMSEAREATASFEEEEEAEGIALTVAVEGTGSGTVTSDVGAISCNPFCSDEYEAGTKVTLTATPAPGSVFYSWKYCDAGGVNGRQCTVTLDKAKTVKATFTTTHALEVAKAPGSGPGKVQSSPGGVLCTFSCSGTTAAFREGAEVLLKQTPAKHFHFVQWLGDCTGSGACQVTMGEDHEVEAEFAEDSKHLLTLTKSGGGAGTVKSSVAGINCGAVCSEQTSAYYQGEVIELSAIPGKGSSFGGWSGACSGTGACVVTTDAAKAVEAEFK